MIRSEYTANETLQGVPRYTQRTAPAKGYSMRGWLMANTVMWLVILPIVARFS